MNIFLELRENGILLAGITGWASAQVIKAILYTILNKEFRLERLLAMGECQAVTLQQLVLWQ